MYTQNNMDEQQLAELIDAYLLGTLTPTEQQQLEDLMAQDPAVATLVEESKKAFAVLEYARQHQLRTKLQGWDAAQLRRRTKNRWWWSVLLLLLLLLLTWLLLSVWFNPGRLTQRMFEPLPGSETTEFFSDTRMDIWNLAAHTYTEKQFEASISLFVQYIALGPPIGTEEARWNIWLAYYAIEGMTEDRKIELHTFLDSHHPRIQENATQLIHLLDSGVYKLLLFRGLPEIQGFKPRLI